MSFSPVHTLFYVLKLLYSQQPYDTLQYITKDGRGWCLLKANLPWISVQSRRSQRLVIRLTLQKPEHWLHAWVTCLVTDFAYDYIKCIVTPVIDVTNYLLL